MSRDDYKFTSPDGHEFWINVCQPVSGETWALKVDEPEKVGGFTRREHGDFSLGCVNSSPIRMCVVILMRYCADTRTPRSLRGMATLRLRCRGGRRAPRMLTCMRRRPSISSATARYLVQVCTPFSLSTGSGDHRRSCGLDSRRARADCTTSSSRGLFLLLFRRMED